MSKLPGRPKKEPTQIIRVPVDRVAVVEKILGRSIVENQTPHVMIRVPSKDVEKIRKAIEK